MQDINLEDDINNFNIPKRRLHALGRLTVFLFTIAFIAIVSATVVVIYISFKTDFTYPEKDLYKFKMKISSKKAAAPVEKTNIDIENADNNNIDDKNDTLIAKETNTLQNSIINKQEQSIKGKPQVKPDITFEKEESLNEFFDGIQQATQDTNPDSINQGANLFVIEPKTEVYSPIDGIVIGKDSNCLVIKTLDNEIATFKGLNNIIAEEGEKISWTSYLGTADEGGILYVTLKSQNNNYIRININSL